MLTEKEKGDIINALQSGGMLKIKPTKSRYVVFLGARLTSIGISLIIKTSTGKGAPRFVLPPQTDDSDGAAPRVGAEKTHVLPYYTPPPFLVSWKQKNNNKIKKKKNSKRKG